jgi:hypothetical protein
MPRLPAPSCAVSQIRKYNSNVQASTVNVIENVIGVIFFPVRIPARSQPGPVAHSSYWSVSDAAGSACSARGAYACTQRQIQLASTSTPRSATNSATCSYDSGYRRYQRTHKMITSPGCWRPLKGVIGMDFYPTSLSAHKFATEPNGSSFEFPPLTEFGVAMGRSLKQAARCRRAPSWRAHLRRSLMTRAPKSVRPGSPCRALPSPEARPTVGRCEGRRGLLRPVDQ